MELAEAVSLGLGTELAVSDGEKLDSGVTVKGTGDVVPLDIEIVGELTRAEGEEPVFKPAEPGVVVDRVPLESG